MASFGFLFDIDGVFLKGKRVFPQAIKALKLLKNSDNSWKVPIVFVTNAGNSLRKDKAATLSKLLNINVDIDQMVMAHSPFSMLEHFHSKYSLVCGQGPLKEISRQLGFHDVITVDEYKHLFPHLDVCDPKRRKAAPCSFEKFQRRVENIILYGEPGNWESSLQIILDLLLSDGHPYRIPENRNSYMNSKVLRKYSSNYPHLPVLACNADLIWKADAPSPRMAHGSFLVALESLYNKFSGNRLLYSAIVGKPSELTYHHAISKLTYLMNKMTSNGTRLRNIYCIGDNPQTDIYGANLYNKYLKSRKIEEIDRIAQILRNNGIKMEKLRSKAINSDIPMKTFHELSNSVISQRDESKIVSLVSILVLTGVYEDFVTMDKSQLPNLINSNYSLNYNHRDFPDDSELLVPNHLANDVYEAVKYVLDKERFPIQSCD